MKLEQMVAATAECWNGTTEVLFNNGYVVSYEKIPYGEQGRGRHKTTLTALNDCIVTYELFESEVYPAICNDFQPNSCEVMFKEVKNKDISDKIYEHLGALENERKNWREFKQQLTEENQIALLKSIGFLE